MVSLADSSSQSPCNSSTRIQPSNGRSMRTVRSSIFQSDDSASFAAPPAGAATSPAHSENLTDSVVDFRLHELAAAIGPSAAKSGPADDLLELSRDFSDFSSFNSDISGELQRLASIQRSPAPNHSSGGSDPSDPPPSEIVETETLESVEPSVKSCVSILADAAAPIEATRAAAARLRQLAKHRSDFRALIGGSGAIGALIPLLKSTDPAAQENAVTALLNLSLEESNKVPVTNAGAIKPLVYALRTGTAAAKQNSACALLSLSMIEENRATIGVCGAIPPLVSLLVGGSSRGKKDALTTLYKLCSLRANKERAVRAGAVGPLVGMVGERGTAEKAMVVLSSLAGVEEGRAAIVEEGGIAALVEAIEEGHGRGREFAVTTLLQLCADCGRNRGLLVREGAIPPLVALSQSGSARAKHKAETLLGYLREQRQDGASTGAER